jgi:hypothetical protein
MGQARGHSNYLRLNRRGAAKAVGSCSFKLTTGDRTMATAFIPSPLLRKALGLDALASAACGLVMAAGASPLSLLLGLPPALLTGAGLACLAWATFVGWTSRRDQLANALVWTIIALNTLWVVESAVILMLSWVQPTALGIAFIISQAAVLLALTEAQYIGLRRSMIAAMPV